MVPPYLSVEEVPPVLGHNAHRVLIHMIPPDSVTQLFPWGLCGTFPPHPQLPSPVKEGATTHRTLTPAPCTVGCHSPFSVLFSVSLGNPQHSPFQKVSFLQKSE